MPQEHKVAPRLELKSQEVEDPWSQNELGHLFQDSLVKEQHFQGLYAGSIIHKTENNQELQFTQ